MLLHTLSNVLILTLLLDGYVNFKGLSGFLFTPSWEGPLMMVLITLLGMGLYRMRKKIGQ